MDNSNLGDSPAGQDPSNQVSASNDMGSANKKSSNTMRILAIVGVFIIALAAIGAYLLMNNSAKDTDTASSTTTAKSDAPLKKITVKLKWKHNAQFAGMYYAQKYGLYKEQGLDVTFEQWTTEAPSATKAVHEKKADFAVSSGTDIITHRANFDRKIVGIATIFQHDPEGYIALKSSGITKLSDIKGKKIGLFPGKNTYIWTALLKAQNLQDISFQTVNMDFSKLPTPESKVLTDKTVDVYATFLTDQAVRFRKEVQANGDDIVNLNPYDYGVSTYNDTVITSDDMIKDDPALVQKFVNATVAGWKAAIKNPEKAVTATEEYDDEEYQPYEAEIFKAEVPFIQTNDSPLLWTDARVWNDMYRLLDQNAVLKKSYDVTEAYNTEFIRAVYNVDK